jgi:hypothetical protein
MTNPTSNFGWQMPTPTDLVTDLPADFEVFGQAVDTSLADLQGGTTGQILAKATNADMDFTWITNDVGDITAVNVTSPITGGGSSGAVTIGINAATTSVVGAVQLSDSTSTTSSVLASTPTATKAAYDLADAAIAKSTLTTAGDIIYRNATVPVRLGIGTAGQVLKVNSGATAPEWGAPSSGKVLQVLSSFNTSTFSTTNTTFTDVTSLSVTITPSSVSSKIRLSGIVSFGHSADVFTVTRFMRDATPIGIADTAGSRTSTTSGNYQGNAGTTGSVVQVPLNYIDSPASTSAITYKIQIAQNSAGTLYVNRSSQDSDTASNIRAISSLIVEEIGA